MRDIRRSVRLVAVDVESVVGTVEAEVLPQPGGLDEDFRADLAEHASAALDVGVAHDRISDTSIDVILGGALLEIGRGLLAVDDPPRDSVPCWLIWAARSCARPSMLCRNRSRFRAIPGRV